MVDESPFEAISSVERVNELAEIGDYMSDEDLDNAFDKVIKLISKPDVPTKVVAPLIVELQAMSVKFKMQAKYYMLYEKGGDAAKRKNTYLSMSDGLDRLVDSLKYLVRNT